MSPPSTPFRSAISRASIPKVVQELQILALTPLRVALNAFCVDLATAGIRNMLSLIGMAQLDDGDCHGIAELEAGAVELGYPELV